MSEHFLVLDLTAGAEPGDDVPRLCIRCGLSEADAATTDCIDGM